MSFYLNSLKKGLHDESEISERSHDDSFFQKDFEKLKGMLSHLKENKARNNQSQSYDDVTMSSETKNLMQRVQARERNQSEDHGEDVSKSRISGDDEVRNLREKLLISETRLAKLQEFNSSLFKKLTNAEAELKKSQEELSKRDYINQIRSLELDDMNQKMSSISLTNQAELEKLKQGYENLRREVFEKQYEIQKYESILREKDEKIKELSHGPEYEMSEMGNLYLENKILREKIVETEKSIDDLYFLKKNDSAILLEIEKLKEDVKRLVQLLRSTEEYKEFAENANLMNDDIRFLKGVHKEKGTNKNFKLWADQRKLKSEFENFFWIPTDAFKYANDFRIKYQGNFTEEIIESLLFELNKIWKEKHEKSISKLKSKYESSISNIKNQYTSSNVQSNLVNQKVISRLRDQVNKGNKDSKTNKKIDDLDALNTTIKQTTRDVKKMQLLENENKQLTAKLQRMMDTSLSRQSHPAFIDGASWLYGKLRKQLDKFVDIFKELIEEFESKLEKIVIDFRENAETNIIISRSKWLISGIETILNSFYESFVTTQDEIPSAAAALADTSVNFTSFVVKSPR